MQKTYLGTVNIGGSEAFTKFTKNLCKTLKAESNDISVVEMIKLSERVDKVDETSKIVRQDKTRQDKTRQDKTIVVGCLDGAYESVNRVYASDGVSPTINTYGGGNREAKILEVMKINKDDSFTTIDGGGTQQIKIVETKQLGHLEKGTGKHQSNIVYDINGTSPCICAGMGVKQQPTMIVEEEKLCCAMRGRNPDNPSDRSAGIPTEQRLELQEDNICNCLTSVQKDSLVLEIKSRIDEKYHPFIYEIDGEYYLIRIRKLTPIETWRLMDFSDEDFEKAQAVNSNTQLYKQSGNSIVKAVLMAIFKKLIESED